jgi:hypothetical protein
MVRQSVNITLEPEVYEEFCKYAEKKKGLEFRRG